ncbi:MAG TPA: LysO family transporter [Bacteroidales bacterium]|nr:LysO family transporter [Bacteroidales bacterium]
MLEILFVMAAGFVAGLLLRKKRQAVLLADKFMFLSICLLLFVLGITIGGDPVILANFPEFGLNAILITIGGVVGSVLAAWATWYFFFMKTSLKE